MARQNPTCLYCKIRFLPDYRNRGRQRYCNGTPECKNASHRASQRKWLRKPGNKDYFRGPENVQRVQQWRKATPGYSRRPRPVKPALHDDCGDKTAENQAVQSNFPISGSFPLALQDICKVQHTVLIGVIAHLTGATLQDDIVQTLRKMQELGNDILNHPTLSNGGPYDPKTPSLSRTTAPRSGAVQLGRPPPGP
jgi:hypothetical protein